MRSRTFSRCRRRPPCTSTLAMTTGPAGKHSTSAACTGRSPTAVNRPPSRSAAGGWSSGPTPGSTTSADSAAAPNAAKPASTPTWRWPPRSSPSVPSAVPPGTSTAGTPDQDHHESADLLADALRAAKVLGLDRSLRLGHVHLVPVEVPELEHHRCCGPIEEVTNRQSEVDEAGMGRTSIRGDEADAGVDAGKQCVGGCDHAQRGASIRWSHVDPAKVDIEVFSPGIRTPLKAAVDAAGQACSESSGTSSAAPREQAPQEALDARPTHDADLQRCLSCPFLDGESW